MPKSQLSKTIRWGAFIPLLVFTLLLVGYFILFFDTHLRWGLQKAGTTINGAKVDIAQLKTSFWNGTLEIKKIEVGNKKEAMKNLVEFDRLFFSFLPGQLVRMKMVVSDFTVEGVHYGTNRTTSNVVPGSSNKPSWMAGLAEKVSKEFYGLIHEEVRENPLAALSNLASGMDVSKAIEGATNLKAKEKIQKLETELSQLDEKWKSIVSGLPNENSLKQLNSKVSGLTSQKPKNPQQAIAMINQANEVIKQVQVETKKVETAQANMNQQAASLENDISSIDNAIDEDVKAVLGNLKVPTLDTKEISKHLFASSALEQIEQITQAVELTRRYLPKQSDSPENDIPKRVRAQGVDYLFGKKQVYPRFLLEKGVLTSDVSEDPTAGDVKGKLTGLTDDPVTYGKPFQGSLNANFPKRQIQDANLTVDIDHTGEVFKENLNASVSSFPVSNWVLNDSSDLRLTVAQGSGSGQLQFGFIDKKLTATIKARIKKAQYGLEMNAKNIQQIVNRLLTSIPEFDLEFKLSGELESLKLDVRSSLGSQLANGLSAEFRHQISAVSKSVRRKVEKEVEAQKRRLNAQFKSQKDSGLQQVQSRLTQINGIQNKAQAELNRIKREQSQSVTKKIEKPLQDIKKKIKLPGF